MVIDWFQRKPVVKVNNEELKIASRVCLVEFSTFKSLTTLARPVLGITWKVLLVVLILQ